MLNFFKNFFSRKRKEKKEEMNSPKYPTFIRIQEVTITHEYNMYWKQYIEIPKEKQFISFSFLWEDSHQMFGEFNKQVGIERCLRMYQNIGMNAEVSGDTIKPV